MREQNKLPTTKFAQIIGFLSIICANSTEFFNDMKL